MNIKKVLWWQFSPKDEREADLYRIAYQKTLQFFHHGTAFIILFVAIMGGYQFFSITEGPMVAFILLTIWILLYCCALCYGGSVFWTEDLTPATQKQKRNLLIAVGLVLALCPLIIWITAIEKSLPHYTPYILFYFALHSFLSPFREGRLNS